MRHSALRKDLSSSGETAMPTRNAAHFSNFAYFKFIGNAGIFDPLFSVIAKTDLIKRTSALSGKQITVSGTQTRSTMVMSILNPQRAA